MKQQPVPGRAQTGLAADRPGRCRLYLGHRRGELRMDGGTDPGGTCAVSGAAHGLGSAQQRTERISLPWIRADDRGRHFLNCRGLRR